MLMVNALAGTGKTTTAILGLGARKPAGMVLSSEQDKIVRAMRAMKWQNAAAMAFNVSIADELKKRVPPGVEAATSNAFGYRAWLAHIGKKRIDVKGYKNNDMFRRVCESEGIPEDKRKILESDISRLVSLCKGHLEYPDDLVLDGFCEKYDIELNRLTEYPLVRMVFDLGVKEFEYFDYDDQIFMPIYHNIKIPQFDLVLVDECQDLNKAKQELAFRMHKKYLVFIGDRNQCIYGFSGADTESVDTLVKRMKEESKDTLELPLTITRRCPKRVVEKANKYVPALKAHDDAPEGHIKYTKESKFLKELIDDPTGRMIVCRVNAPLAALAFRLIANNRRCYIQGKDIGTGIKKDISKTKKTDLKEAVDVACKALIAKMEKLKKAKFVDEAKVEALQDRITCILYLSDGLESIEEFNEKVDSLFKDSGDKNDHQLTSVHKSKGLESRHVCIYKPSKLPFTKMMKSKKNGEKSFQYQQELNLVYVAYTRSMDTLTFVQEDVKTDDFPLEVFEEVDEELAEDIIPC